MGPERPEPADNEHGRKQHAHDGIASLKGSPRSFLGQIRPESRVLFELSLRHKPEVQRLDEVDELHRCTTVVFTLEILCGLVASQNGGAEKDMVEHPDDALRILSHVKLSCLRCPVDAEPVAQRSGSSPTESSLDIDSLFLKGVSYAVGIKNLFRPAFFHLPGNDAPQAGFL